MKKKLFMRLFLQLDEKWSANECRLVWNNSVNPKINREKWSADEEERLKKLARKYRERNWLSISLELNVSEKTLIENFYLLFLL